MPEHKFGSKTAKLINAASSASGLYARLYIAVDNRTPANANVVISAFAYDKDPSGKKSLQEGRKIQRAVKKGKWPLTASGIVEKDAGKVWLTLSSKSKLSDTQVKAFFKYIAKTPGGAFLKKIANVRTATETDEEAPTETEETTEHAARRQALLASTTQLDAAEALDDKEEELAGLLAKLETLRADSEALPADIEDAQEQITLLVADIAELVYDPLNDDSSPPDPLYVAVRAELAAIVDEQIREDNETIIAVMDDVLGQLSELSDDESSDEMREELRDQLRAEFKKLKTDDYPFFVDNRSLWKNETMVAVLAEFDKEMSGRDPVDMLTKPVELHPYHIGKSVGDMLTEIDRAGRGPLREDGMPSSGVFYPFNVKACPKQGYADPTLFDIDPKMPLTYTIKAGQSASAAITSLIKGPTAVDCAGAVQLSMYATMLRTLGAEKFDALFKRDEEDLENFPGLRIDRDFDMQNPKNPLGRYLAMTALSSSEGSSVGDRAAPLGSWVYFSNDPDYPKLNPSGFWSGENSLVCRDQTYKGFGIGDPKSEAKILSDLAGTFNDTVKKVLSSDDREAALARVSHPERYTDFTDITPDDLIWSYEPPDTIQEDVEHTATVAKWTKSGGYALATTIKLATVLQVVKEYIELMKTDEAYNATIFRRLKQEHDMRKSIGQTVRTFSRNTDKVPGSKQLFFRLDKMPSPLVRNGGGGFKPTRILALDTDKIEQVLQT